MLLFEEGERRVDKLAKAVLKDVVILVDLFAECFDGVEEGVQVESLAVVLALHILEADVQVCLEKLVHSRKLGHTRQF